MLVDNPIYATTDEILNFTLQARRNAMSIPSDRPFRSVPK